MKNRALLRCLLLAGGVGGWNASALGQCTADGIVNTYGCQAGEPWTFGNCWFFTRPPLVNETAAMASAGTVPLAAAGACSDLSLFSGSRVAILQGGTLNVFGDCIALSQGGVDLMPAPATMGSATMIINGAGTALTGPAVFSGTADGIALAARSEATLADASLTGNGSLIMSGRVSIAGTGTVAVGITNDAQLPDEPPLGRDFGVLADVAGRTLSLTAGGTNNAAMEARGGGILSLANVWTQGPTGTIRARDAGSTVLINTPVTGGTVDSRAGASVAMTGSATYQDLSIAGDGQHTLAGSLLGTISIAVESSPVAPGGFFAPGTVINNDGRLTLGDNTGNDSMVINFPTLIRGVGELVLTAVSAANPQDSQIIPVSFGANQVRLTNDSGHTVRGAGDIAVPLINRGGVIANVTDVPIELTNVSVTNSGDLTASNGGFFDLAFTTIDQAGGGRMRTITALSGGRSRFQIERDVVVLGGQLSGDTVVTSVRNRFEDLRLGDVFGPAADALVEVLPGADLLLGGTIENFGTIDVNPSAGAGQAILSSPAFNGIATLLGDGEIVLSAESESNLASATMGSGFLIGPDQTLRGTGQVTGSLLAAEGAVLADVPGRTLELGAIDSRTGAVVGSLGSGTLRILGRVTGAGGVAAFDASRVEIGESGDVEATTLSGVGTGVVAFIDTPAGGPPLLRNGVTFEGNAEIASGVTLDSIADTIVNNGILIVGDRSAALNALLRLRNGGVRSLSGAGTLLLNAADPANLAEAQLVSSNTTELRNEAGHTIAGRGLIRRESNGTRFANEGTIAPGGVDGDATAVIFVTNITTELRSGGVVEFDIAGPLPGTGHDQLSSDSPVFVGGDSVLRFAPGFSPNVGDSFDLVIAPGNGIFDSITETFERFEIRGLSGGLGAVLRYSPSEVTALVIDIDLNGDGAADFFDILRYLELFDAGDPAAEFDGLTGLTAGDVRAFISAFPVD